MFLEDGLSFPNVLTECTSLVRFEKGMCTNCQLCYSSYEDLSQHTKEHMMAAWFAPWFQLPVGGELGALLGYYLGPGLLSQVHYLSLHPCQILYHYHPADQYLTDHMYFHYLLQTHHPQTCHCLLYFHHLGWSLLLHPLVSQSVVTVVTQLPPALL